MRILDILRDDRIKATSVFLEMTVGDYLRLVSGAEKNLEIQRAIVKGFKPYERLRKDLRRGCIVPAPVLASRAGTIESPSTDTDAAFVSTLSTLPPESIYIVDGLQRTNAIQQAHRELDNDERDQFSARLMRVEFWPDISLSALTYRMILLNAGQKPMSLKHQMEILSTPLSDALSMRFSGMVEIYREKDDDRRSGPGQYQFSLIASSFQAFVQRSPHVQIRNDIVEELNKLDVLETYGASVGVGPTDGAKDPLDGFYEYFDFLLTLDSELWRIYPRNAETVDGLDIPSARTLLSRETFHLGLAAAYGWCLDGKAAFLKTAREKLLTDLKAAAPGSDPLALGRFDQIQSGFKRRDNIGEQARDLVFNGFKEYFRGEGQAAFERIWVEAGRR